MKITVVLHYKTKIDLDRKLAVGKIIKRKVKNLEEATKIVESNKEKISKATITWES